MLEWLTGGLLPAGQPAPEFSLPDQSGNVVTLRSLRGRPVVLVFYPGNDTPLCTKQLCEIRDDWTAFRKHDAAVFGVNGFGGGSLRRFAEKFRFPFALLADRGWKMTRAYHCGWGITTRSVYVIDADGRIAYARRGKPSVPEILEAVAAACSSRS